MEHRWGSRVQTNFAVRLVGSPGTIGSGRLRNVSVTGAFVETRLSLPLLAVVHVEPIPSPSGRTAARRIAACAVRRTSDGVGLEWCDPTSHLVDELLDTAHCPSLASSPESTVSARKHIRVGP